MERDDAGKGQRGSGQGFGADGGGESLLLCGCGHAGGAMKRVLPFLAGGAVLAGHLAFRILSPSPPGNEGWGNVAAPLPERFAGYFSTDGIWLGASYAI